MSFVNLISGNDFFELFASSKYVCKNLKIAETVVIKDSKINDPIILFR
jgi:hypothetical protein